MPRLFPYPLHVLLVCGAAAVAWSAAWWGFASLAGRQFDGWIAAEEIDGRKWTCPERRLEGFPLALVLGCARPTFRGEVAGHDSDGVVERLEVTVSIAHPATAAVVMHGPLALRARDDAFLVSLNWGALDLTLPLALGEPPAGGTVSATRLAVSGSAPGRGDVNLRVARLEGSVGPAGDEPADRRFAVTLAGVTLPTLEGVPGLENGVPEASASGVLAGAALLTTPTVARLEAWRQDGGSLRLDALRFSTGAVRGSATGTLSLDGARRPAGTLDLALVGFEPLARRLGIPVAGVQIGGLLASVLGGGRPAAPSEPGALRLPLTLGDGQVRLGPFPLGVRLAPLY